MDESLTSPPPGLLKLPAELLYQVFDDVYMNWSEVAPTSRKSSRPPTSPLSRALVDYQRQGLYRVVTLKTRKNSVRFFKSILAQPRLASLVTSLTLRIPGTSGRSNSNGTEVSPDEIETCFSSLVNLEALSLREYTAVHFPSLLSILTSNALSSKCTSITLALPGHRQDALSSLPLNMTRCNLEVVGYQTAAIGKPEDAVSRPPFSSLSSLSLWTNQYHSDGFDLWRSFIARCDSLRRICLHRFSQDDVLNYGILQSPSLQSITELSFLGEPRYHLDLASILPHFSNLLLLTLEVDCLDPFSHGFFDALRELPLEILTFTGDGSASRSWWLDAPPVPSLPSLPSLEALISAPTQHLTLRTLKLDCVPSDPETDTPLVDLSVDERVVPNLPRDYSIEGLKALQLAGEKNGVVIEGSVFNLAEELEACGLL
ncbi:hypothetical protein JCM3765_007674 [Sporobolomyces pararoseus]